jgi:hypothetical protein
MSRLAQPSPRRLWTFHGGIHMADEKALSNGSPIAPIPLPPRLVIPLAQHIGTPARPCVRVGERVLKGQLIGDFYMGLRWVSGLWRWAVLLWLLVPGGLITAAFLAAARGTA